MILERIREPSDVKKLTLRECNILCGEMRQFLVEKVSRTGGHLASNLGAVELTVAIHRVFNTARDRLVFDVGHQCYVHKALTGRRELFDTLRQLEGLSGFPKPRESVHDAFIAGHASNSVSVALGMAKARTLQGGKYAVLALIGDGAMTGGLAFEGLNNAGTSGEPLIVILNDNGMSIAPNVGALNTHLATLRTRPGYYAFKQGYKKLVGDGQLYQLAHNVKSSLKRVILPSSTMFEEMGFTYLGPVDGHDVESLTGALSYARELQRPVVLHVLTKKGKGYAPAEKNPGKFHGIGAFDPATGDIVGEKKPSFSDVFGETLCRLAGEDSRICAISAAMVDGTGLTAFAERYPQRFTDVGIAEGHAVAMAAGMAKQGLIPVFAVYSSFLQRGFDMLFHDVSLQKLHVVFAVDRAGLVGADGETHHGCFDPLYLSQIPGMTVLCPANFAELRSMLRRAVLEIDGPVAVRYPRGGEGAFRENTGTVPFAELRRGGDGTLVAYGVMINEALRAAELLHEKGLEMRVVKLNTISPITKQMIVEAFPDDRRVLVVEDAMGVGCVGQRIAAIMAQYCRAPQRLILRNLGCQIPGEGKVEDLYRVCGLDAESLSKAMEDAIHEQ